MRNLPTRQNIADLAALVRARLRPPRSPTTHFASGAPRSITSEAFTGWLVDHAIAGFGPFDSAAALARSYSEDRRYPHAQARLDAIVRHEASKSFTMGFVTALPGPLAAPVALPTALVATWLIQARLVAAMAILCGHTASDLWVRTTVLLALDDARVPAALREAGLDSGQWASLGLAQHLAQPVLHGLWKRASEALLKQAARRGWTRLGRSVPVLGAMVAGGLDAYGCAQVAARTRGLLLPNGRILPP